VNIIFQLSKKQRRQKTKKEMTTTIVCFIRHVLLPIPKKKVRRDSRKRTQEPLMQHKTKNKNKQKDICRLGKESKMMMDSENSDRISIGGESKRMSHLNKREKVRIDSHLHKNKDKNGSFRRRMELSLREDRRVLSKLTKCSADENQVSAFIERTCDSTDSIAISINNG
jgi:hypothetical protein